MDDLVGLLGVFTTVIGLLLGGRSLVARYWDSPRILGNPLTYGVIGASVLISALLPIGLYLEFPPGGTGEHARFGFYARHYPHLVIYPPLLFGIASLLIFRTAALYWKVSRAALMLRVGIALAVATVSVVFEASGSSMMLLEFNKAAQTASLQFSDPAVRARSAELGLGEAWSPPLAVQVRQALQSAGASPPARQEPVASLLDRHDAWDELDVEWKSKSRLLYLAVFFQMQFVMALAFAFLPYTRRAAGWRPQDDATVSLNLIGGFLVFLMWFPFRAYSNLHTKVPLFGSAAIDNYLGPIPSFSVLGLYASDVAPMLAILLFLGLLAVRVANLSKALVVGSLSLLGCAAALGMLALAALRPTAFAQVTGLDGELRYVVFRIIVITLTLLLIYNFVASMNEGGDDDGTGDAAPPAPGNANPRERERDAA